MPTYEVTYLNKQDQFRMKRVYALDEAYIELRTREEFPDVKKIIKWRQSHGRGYGRTR